MSAIRPALRSLFQANQIMRGIFHRGVSQTPGVAPVNGMALGMNLAALDTFNGAYAFANMVNHADNIYLASGTATYSQVGGVLTVSAVTGTATFVIYIADNADAALALPTTGNYKFVNAGGMPAGLGGFGSYTIFAKNTVTTPQDVPAPASYPNGMFINFEVSAPGTYNAPQLWWPGTYGTGAILTPTMLSWHASMGTKWIRTMDWSRTNYNIDTDWSDRPLSTQPMFTNANGPQVPWDIQFQVANQLGADIWINVPARATQAYVDSLAALAAATLNAGRKVAVETSNEPFNGYQDFALQQNWIGYNQFTKKTATVNPGTGVVTTSVAHGLVTGDIIAPFVTRTTRLKKFSPVGPGLNNNYYIERGIQTRVVVTSATTFTMEQGAPGDPPGTAINIKPECTDLIYVLTTEAGKTFDWITQYALIAERNWKAFDTALGSSRVVAVYGGQAVNTNLTNSLLSKIPAMVRKPDVFAIAPYFHGFWHGGQLTKGVGTLALKWWSTDRVGSTVHVGRYTNGSTPTDAQVIAGTGTGFLSKVSGRVGWGFRDQVPVSITFASPAVVTWDTVAPANGTTLQFQTTGALPTGLAVSTTYYVVNASGNTFQVSATSGGAAINTTGAGSGTHTAIAFLPLANYLDIPNFSGLANATYTVPVVVVDFMGNRWRFDNTVVIDGTASTVDVLDTFANQNKRVIADLCEPSTTNIGQLGILDCIQSHKSQIASSSVPTMQLWDYEGNMHADEEASQGVPARMKVWLEDYSESSSMGDMQKMYLGLVSAAGTKAHMQFSDIAHVTYVGPNWGVSDNYTDTADVRFVALSSFAGSVPTNTLLDSATTSGNNVLSDPGNFPTPTDLYDFVDATYTYTLVNNGQNDNGNYQISGTKLQMIGATGINFAAPQNRTVKVLATGTKMCAIVPVTFQTGNAWYQSDAAYALKMSAQGSTASLTPEPSMGGVLALTGSGAAIATNLLVCGTSASYANSTAMPATQDFTKPCVIAFLGNSNSTVYTGAVLLWVGSGGRWIRCSPDTGALYWEINDGSTIVNFSMPWDNVTKSNWCYHDGAGNYTFGRDATTAGTTTQAAPSGPNATISQSVSIGSTNAKIGTIEAVWRTGLTLAQAKTIAQGLPA